MGRSNLQVNTHESLEQNPTQVILHSCKEIKRICWELSNSRIAGFSAVTGIQMHAEKMLPAVEVLEGTCNRHPNNIEARKVLKRIENSLQIIISVCERAKAGINSPANDISTFEGNANRITTDLTNMVISLNKPTVVKPSLAPQRTLEEQKPQDAQEMSL